jgi:hypothetical protein
MLTVRYVRDTGEEGLYCGWFFGPEMEGPNGLRRRFRTDSGEVKTFLMKWIVSVIRDGEVVYGEKPRKPQPRKGGKFAKA